MKEGFSRNSKKKCFEILNNFIKHIRMILGYFKKLILREKTRKLLKMEKWKLWVHKLSLLLLFNLYI